MQIAKPGGGVRELGVPTVLDRLIQQAILQVLRIFDPEFSEQSAHQAVETARAFVQAGGTWVLDVDLDRFFDRVNHDALMARVARKVGDRRLLKLIRRFLEAGVMSDGVVIETERGPPRVTAFASACQHHARRSGPRTRAAGPPFRPLCRRSPHLRGDPTGGRAGARFRERVHSSSA